MILIGSSITSFLFLFPGNLFKIAAPIYFFTVFVTMAVTLGEDNMDFAFFDKKTMSEIYTFLYEIKPVK